MFLFILTFFYLSNNVFKFFICQSILKSKIHITYLVRSLRENVCIRHLNPMVIEGLLILRLQLLLNYPLISKKQYLKLCLYYYKHIININHRRADDGDGIHSNCCCSHIIITHKNRLYQLHTFSIRYIFPLSHMYVLPKGHNPITTWVIYLFLQLGARWLGYPSYFTRCSREHKRAYNAINLRLKCKSIPTA